MFRRSSFCLVAPLEMPKDIADWGRIRSLTENLTVGRCTDSTVLDSSIMSTRHLQRALFRLPVPKLQKTCARYMDAVKPLVPPKQFEATAQIVQEFESNEGAKLHDELVRTDKANKHTSYISADWFDLYLNDRKPLPINYNPCLLTRRDPDKMDMLTRAAFWISSSVDFYRMYLDDTLKPDVFYFGSKDHYCRKDWFQRTVAYSPEYIAAKMMMIGSNFHGFPLDMSQYENLMSSTRIPGVLKDEIKAVGFTPHILVQHHGHQYIVTVADDKQRPLPVDQIYARLRAITELKTAPPKVDVGIFTTMERTQWHAVRLALTRHNENQRNLEEIDTAMFVLNLDDDVTVDFLSLPGAVRANRSMLVQDSNRWWDKSLSVIVSKDGFLGVNFEHSWGDGVAVLRYTQDVFNHSIARSSKNLRRDVAPTEPLRQLRWSLTPEIEAEAAKAKTRVAAEIRRMDFSTNIISGIGARSDVFRDGLVKADPLMQVAMQLAWWRLNKSTVSTYESASTAAFLRGRTECIRSATPESQAFTMLMDKPSAPASEKMQALVRAVQKHNSNAKNAKMGEGIDRHLFALLKIAERRDPQRIPALFTDPSYTTMGSNMLSTSSLYSDSLIGGGFGPVSAGYGVGYAAAPECLLFNVSCWREGGPMHSAEEFSQAIYASIVDMYNLISTSKGVSK